MPAPYGVTETGFSKKSTGEQLAELETAMQADFGAGVVQDAQSPLGQLNGMFADALGELWDIAEAIYGSFDPDQATGTRLDAIGKLRRIFRSVNESDGDYRLRITLAGTGFSKTQLLENAINAVTGVTYSDIVENDTGNNLPNGLNSHSLAIVVEGGADVDVAEAIWLQKCPGVGLHGNTFVEILDNGKCRTIEFVRPQRVSVYLNVNVSINPANCACAPATVDEIVAAIITEFTGSCQPSAGAVITPNTIRAAVMNNAEGINVEAVTLSRESGVTPGDRILYFSIFELPEWLAENISVSYVAYDAPTESQGAETIGLDRGAIA